MHFILLLILLHLCRGRDVCTPHFTSTLSSFFITKNPLTMARDELDLCQLCQRVVRLAFLYANLPQTSKNWSPTLLENACTYAQKDRVSDCESLSKAVVDVLGDYFSSSSSKFSGTDLSMSHEDLRNQLEIKSATACNDISCCVPRKRNGKKDTAPVLQPPQDDDQLRSEIRNLNEQRLTLQQQKLALDSVRAETKKVIDREEERLKQKDASLTHRANQIKSEMELLNKRKENFTIIEAKMKSKQKDLDLWQKELEKIELDLEKDRNRTRTVKH